MDVGVGEGGPGLGGGLEAAEGGERVAGALCGVGGVVEVSRGDGVGGRWGGRGEVGGGGFEGADGLVGGGGAAGEGEEWEGEEGSHEEECGGRLGFSVGLAGI
jgi:hypothetical protein